MLYESIQRLPGCKCGKIIGLLFMSEDIELLVCGVKYCSSYNELPCDKGINNV